MAAQFPDSLDDCPPPAYEFSQAEFDQKLADATAQSLSLSEHGRTSAPHERDCDARRYDSTSCSQYQSHPLSSSASASTVAAVSPLSFKRRTHGGSRSSLIDSTYQKGDQRTTGSKEKPSWLSEAQLDTSSSSSAGAPRSRQLPLAPVQRPQPSSFNDPHSRPRSDARISSPPEDGCGDAPPPFAPRADPLDSTAYEQLAGVVQPLVVLRYNGSGADLSASPPPSPPQSPALRPREFGTRPRTATPRVGIGDQAGYRPFTGNYQTTQEQSARRLTPQPQTHYPQQLRPQAQSIHPHPRLAFDPSIAYENGSRSVYGQMPADSMVRANNAAALYSSAVSQIFDSQASSRQARQGVPVVTKSKRYAPSICPSLPEYDIHDQPAYADSQMKLPSKISVSSSQQQFSSHRNVSTTRLQEPPADGALSIPYPQYPQYPQNLPHSVSAPHEYYTHPPSQSAGIYSSQHQQMSADPTQYSNRLYPR